MTLPLGLIEMVPQYDVHQIRLWNSTPVSNTLDELLVVIRNHKLFVLLRKSPTAHIAVQATSSTNATLDVVALFAERLPVTEIVRTISGAWNLMIRAESYIGFLRPTRGTPVTVLLLDFSPLRSAGFSAWFTFLAYLEALKLVSSAFLDDAGETFLALQLPQTAKDILVGSLSSSPSEFIHNSPNLNLCQRRSRNPVPRRPKCSQDDRIVELVRGAGRNETALRLCKPSFTTSFRFVGRHSRCEQESFASTRTTHGSGRP